MNGVVEGGVCVCGGGEVREGEMIQKEKGKNMKAPLPFIVFPFS